MGKESRRAFSLIEVLVVIGIIAVLVAILLPSLLSARRAAQTVACLSNLRELGQLISHYAHQRGGYAPSDDYKPDSFKRWPQILFDAGLHPHSTDTESFPKDVLRCPSVEPGNRVRFGLVTRWGTDYGLNFFLVSGGASKNDPPANPIYAYRTKLSRVKMASETVLAGDSGGAEEGRSSNDTWSGQEIHPGGPRGDTGCCDLRHSKRWNCLFVDGHAENRRDAEQGLKWVVP